MTLQVGRAGIRQPSASQIAAWRTEFAARHAIRIGQFFEPALHAWIRDRLAAAPFTLQVHDDTDPPALNRQLNDPALQQMLRILLNDAHLFQAVEAVTGCGAIGSCLTHVYSLDPSPDSRDAWHGDVDGNRLIAISINVGGAYEGGVLQIRDAATRRILNEISNTEAGGAVLFRIDESLQHFVTPITRGRRLALAGWFQRSPTARALLGIPHP